MVKLIEVTDAHRASIASGMDALSRLTGLMVPTGWPVYPDIFRQASDSSWPLFLFTDPDRAAIVGSGGFLTAPDSHGLVQIGYEVAPEHRGRGIATQAMREVLRSSRMRALSQRWLLQITHPLPSCTSSASRKPARLFAIPAKRFRYGQEHRR